MTAGPQARLESILERLDAASDQGTLQEITEDLRDHFRIRHIVYHWVSAAGQQYGVGTYAPA